MTPTAASEVMDDTGTVLVSIVIPVFNEHTAIEPFLEALRKVEEDGQSTWRGALSFEYVFVNDGSTDETLIALLAARDRFSAIRIVDLSRNFGKEAALTAGIDFASGSAVIPIDVDLQDPPHLIIPMLEAWRAGSEVVLARRISRHEDTNMKRITAHLFYKLHNSMSHTQIPRNVGDFRLMDRAVVEALRRLPENRRFMKGLFAWVGFKTAVLDYARAPRRMGQTKFSGLALWRLAVEGVTSFSVAPLVVWTYIGLFISFVSIFLALLIALQKLFFGLDIPGYAALSIGVFFLSGVQIMGIGILGEYLGRTYLEAKRRPSYIVRKYYDKAD